MRVPRRRIGVVDRMVVVASRRTGRAGCRVRLLAASAAAGPAGSTRAVDGATTTVTAVARCGARRRSARGGRHAADRTCRHQAVPIPHAGDRTGCARARPARRAARNAEGEEDQIEHGGELQTLVRVQRDVDQVGGDPQPPALHQLAGLPYVASSDSAVVTASATARWSRSPGPGRARGRR